MRLTSILQVGGESPSPFRVRKKGHGAGKGITPAFFLGAIMHNRRGTRETEKYGDFKLQMRKSRRGDLNPRPADYESAAIPLSHGGAIPHNIGLCANKICG
jgi:hypothetical protein